MKEKIHNIISEISNNKVKFICNIVLHIIVIYMLCSIRILVVSGYSMTPTYKDGDIKIGMRVSSESDIEVDKVYVYEQSDGNFIIHRLIRIEDSKYIFKGDGNLVEDAEPVDFEYVRYRVLSK